MNVSPAMNSKANSNASAPDDRAIMTANPDEVAFGSTSIRLHDLVNRGSEFDLLYLYEPLLAACHLAIGQPFRLSSMLARTVKPNSKAQALHTDVKRVNGLTSAVGFIFMVDDFRADNGATRFVPGSHWWGESRCEDVPDRIADHPGQELALGSAGSVIIYDGTVWHGHTSNGTNDPRRSIQGMFIQRDGPIRSSQTIHMLPETLSRIGALAKYLVC